ncbi:hypothetical protein HDU67_002299 [Dinochytrium kinnereticum]|nr:hypothetical protein HDU67_002299 [Dinochytrium kinnereticum]
MKVLQTLRWARSLPTWQAHLPVVRYMGVMTASSTVPPLRLHRLSASSLLMRQQRARMASTEIAQVEMDAESGAPSLPRETEAAAQGLLNALKDFSEHQMKAEDFSEQCVKLLKSIRDGEPLLENLTSANWTAIMSVLASEAFSRKDVRLKVSTMKRAWLLMSSINSGPKVSDESVGMFVRTMVHAGRVVNVEGVENIYQMLLNTPGMTSKLMRIAYVSLGFGLAKNKNCILGWDAVQQGWRHFVDLKEKSALLDDEQKMLRMFNNHKDYDEFLTYFLEVNYQKEASVKPAKIRVQDILTQKAKEGHKVTIRNLGILAHLTLAPTEIRQFLDVIYNEYKLEPDSAIFSKLTRNAVYAGDIDLGCELLVRAAKTPTLRYRTGIVRHSLRHVPGGDVKKIMRLINSALEVDPSLNDNAELSAELVEIVASNCKPGSRMDQAKLIDVWESIPQDTIKKLPAATFCKVIHVHVECGAIRQALDIYREGRPQILDYLSNPPGKEDVAPSKSERSRQLSQVKEERKKIMATVDSLLLECCHNISVSAKSLYDELRFVGFVPSTNVYTALVSILGYFSPDEITRLLSEMRAHNVPRSEKFYTSILTILSKSARMGATILDEMAKDGIAPNVYTYNALISGLLKNGEMQKGNELMEMMKSQGIQPDVATFNILLEGCLSRGKWREANNVLNDMAAADIKRDVVTFNTLISAHGRRDGGDPKQGKVLFDAMQRPPYKLKPSRNTFNGLIRCHLALREWAEAESLLKSLESHPSPNMRPDARIYDTYLRNLADESATSIQPAPLVAQIDRALSLMQSRGIMAQTTTLSALIRSAGKRQNIDDAKRYHSLLASQMLFPDSDGVNSAMISAFDSCGDYAGAIAWADSQVPGSGSGRADVDALKGNGKVIRIGRASTYALMVSHGKARNEQLVDAVWEQLKRLEEVQAGVLKEIKGKGGYGMNEINVFIQVYNYLGNLDKAMAMWRSSFTVPAIRPENAKSEVEQTRPAELTTTNRVVKSSSAAKGLVDLYGVDRITVSLIIDTVGANSTLPALQSLWSGLVASGFPMDLNNWISYLEALARLGANKEMLELVKSSDGIRSQFTITEKVFWSVLPNMRDRERAREFWEILKTDFPELEGGVRVKMARFLTSNPWLEN